MAALNICRLSPSPPSPPRTLRLRSRTSPRRRAESFKELKAGGKKEGKKSHIWKVDQCQFECGTRGSAAAEVREEERRRANEEESDLFITSLFFRGRKKLNDGGALLPFRLSPSHSHIFLFFYFFYLLVLNACTHAFSQSPPSRCYIRLTFTHVVLGARGAASTGGRRAAAQREAISRLPLHRPCLHLLPRQ